MKAAQHGMRYDCSFAQGVLAILRNLVDVVVGSWERYDVDVVPLTGEQTSRVGAICDKGRPRMMKCSCHDLTSVANGKVQDESKHEASLPRKSRKR